MKLLYIWAKILKKIRGSAILNSSIDKTSKIESGSHIVNSKFDRHSYCGYNCEIINAEIGSFCSIANNVVIGGSQHPIEWVSTSPVFLSGRDSVKKKYSKHQFNNNIKTRIGHDVWIGESALIKQGVNVGIGAVIGMGSVVTKDVDPYCIVGGSPAKIIRKRFEDRIITELLEICWWGFDDHKLKEFAPYFNNPVKFIEMVKIK
jgi:acetyltransferase-like isoleucine patch superfamily enzyme